MLYNSFFGSGPFKTSRFRGISQSTHSWTIQPHCGRNWCEFRSSTLFELIQLSNLALPCSNDKLSRWLKKKEKKSIKEKTINRRLIRNDIFLRKFTLKNYFFPGVKELYLFRLIWLIAFFVRSEWYARRTVSETSGVFFFSLFKNNGGVISRRRIRRRTSSKKKK